jgi:Ca2+-binding RTX toxin-like protein
MTTYTLTGLAVYRDSSHENTVGIDSSDVTLEFVVRDSTSTFIYRTTPSPEDDRRDEFGHIVLDFYTVRINGMTVGTDIPFNPIINLDEVVWRDAGGALHTSTVLGPFLEDVSVPGLGVVAAADYIFVVSGSPLPVINTVAEWDVLEDRVVSIGTPTGTYRPDTPIALTSLGALVSERDIITGTSDAEVFKSGAGNDVIRGLGGNDVLFGQGGNDTLFGDSGIDSLKGHDGHDKLFGGSGPDGLYGGSGRDKLFGGHQDDSLNGGKGADSLLGGGGHDFLSGDPGNDTLRGGFGNDRLNGGRGSDKMIGDGGVDTFVFSPGTDVITDFNAANNREKIDLSGVSSITGFKNLKTKHLNDVGGNAVIDDGNGNTLTLDGVGSGDLDKGDFIF